MNQQDEQFGERNFCYYKRGSHPFYEKCKDCHGYVKDPTVCADYTCDNNYKAPSSPSLIEKMEEYVAKWKAEGFFDTKSSKKEPVQLELEYT
jgi:hypothetical protein